MRLRIATVVVAIAVALTGCTAGNTPKPGPTPAAHPLPAPVITRIPVPVPTNTETIQQQLVDTLKTICTSLTDYAADPINWKMTSNNTGSAPYELALDGDGGSVIVNVTPGTPYAALTVSSTNFDTTNALLAYSGCASITTIPPAPQPVPTQNYVAIPDFTGHMYNDMVNWENRADVSFTAQTHLGVSWTGPATTSCGFPGNHLIVSQDLRPGTEVAQGTSPVMHIVMYCP